MKIVITGGAGFIASHIADAYIEKGHDVVVIDNMHHGFQRNVPKKSKLYTTDIRDTKKLRSIFKKERPDIVNHHAAIASVTGSMDNPTITHEVNVLGTINLLDVAREFEVKRFIMASTGGAMYGDGATIPVTDDTQPKPESPYGLSKQLAEEAVRYYARQSRKENAARDAMRYVIFRYANVYGPRQNPKGEAGVCAIFSELLANGKTPTIFGDGSKTRDYVYVKDIVRANVAALRLGKDITMNLGTGVETTDLTVYEEIAQYFTEDAFTKAPEPHFAPVRAGELERSALQADIAQQVLRWAPRYTFAAGINEYIQESL